MKPEDGMKRFREITEEMYNLHKKKNHDYAAKDYLANITASEAFGIDPMIAIVVRLIDKTSRIASFCEQGVLCVKNEKVEDTLTDIAVYAVLARIIYESRRKGKC